MLEPMLAFILHRKRYLDYSFMDERGVGFSWLACREKRARHSALTVRTPEGRALPKHGLANRRSASAAGFAFAAVDVQFAEEITGRTVGVEKIAQCRAAAFDRPGEDALHFGRQSCVAFARHRPGSSTRIDARGE